MTVQIATAYVVENERVFGESSGHDDDRHESETSLNMVQTHAMLHATQHMFSACS